MWQTDAFAKSVQRYPVPIATVFGVFNDETVCGSIELHVCSRFTIIIQLDFVHMLQEW